MFFINGGTIPLLINRGVPRLHRDLRVVVTSQPIQVQIISGSRVPLCDHPFRPLPRLTNRGFVWSERQSAHLNPIIIGKCRPITLKSLTVRGSHKHPSALTKHLTEEHSIHTRYISQEIGNGMMTNTNKTLGGWEVGTGRR